MSLTDTPVATSICGHLRIDLLADTPEQRTWRVMPDDEPSGYFEFTVRPDQPRMSTTKPSGLWLLHCADGAIWRLERSMLGVCAMRIPGAGPAMPGDYLRRGHQMVCLLGTDEPPVEGAPFTVWHTANDMYGRHSFASPLVRVQQLSV